MPPFVTWLPDQIVCDRCYSVVADIDEPTDHVLAVFKDGNVRHAQDGRVLSEVTWRNDQITEL